MLFNLNKNFNSKAFTSTTLVLVSSVFLSLSPVLAQTVVPETVISQASESNISQSELQQFAKIIEKIYVIDNEKTQQIVQILQKEGMSVDRFNAIVKWKKNQEAPTPPVSDSEMKNFEKVIAQIAPVQEQANVKIKEVFETQELEVERFNQILEAVSQDPKLQGQVQQILEN